MNARTIVRIVVGTALLCILSCGGDKDPDTSPDASGNNVATDGGNSNSSTDAGGDGGGDTGGDLDAGSGDAGGDAATGDAGSGMETEVEVVGTVLPDPSSIEPMANFGWATAIAGDVAFVSTNPVVGSGSANVPSVVYTYERGTDGTWTEGPALGDGVEIDIDDGYGWSLAAEGQFAFVGAPFQDAPNGNTVGRVQAFVRLSDGSWNLISDVAPVDDFGRKRFGIDVAFDANRLAVGAVDDSKVYAYEVVEVDFGTPCNDRPECWTISRFGVLQPDSAAENFGAAVDLSGDTAIVTGNNANGRTAYFFEVAGDGMWTETQMIEVAGDSFLNDWSVAISGDVALIGRPGTQTVEIWERQGDGTWAADPTAALTGTAPDFGRSVDIVGGRIVVGAAGGGSLFVRDEAGDWIEADTFGPLGDASQQFGADVSLAADARRFSVGSRVAPGNQAENGETAVFEIVPVEQ